MAGINKESSQYSDTDIVNDYITYLDIWVPKEIPKTVNDTAYIIPSKFHKRPDLLAHDLYGTPRLWWVFSVRNKDLLVDPIEDFISGLSILLTPRNVIERII